MWGFHVGNGTVYSRIDRGPFYHEIFGTLGATLNVICLGERGAFCHFTMRLERFPSRREVATTIFASLASGRLYPLPGRTLPPLSVTGIVKWVYINGGCTLTLYPCGAPYRDVTLTRVFLVKGGTSGKEGDLYRFDNFIATSIVCSCSFMEKGLLFRVFGYLTWNFWGLLFFIMDEGCG